MIIASGNIAVPGGSDSNFGLGGAAVSWRGAGGAPYETRTPLLEVTAATKLQVKLKPRPR